MSIAYGGIVAFFFRGLNMAVALGTVLLTSHLLTEENLGGLLLGLSIVGFVNASTGGLTAAVAYQIANQRRAAGAALFSGGVPGAALSAFAILAGIGAGILLSGESSRMAIPIGFATAAVICNGIVAGAFLGRDSLIRYNCALVAAPLFSLIAVLFTLVVLDQRTPEAALTAYAVGQWASLAIMVVTSSGMLFDGVAIDSGMTRAILNFALLAAISSGVSYLSHRADLFVVEHFEGKVGVGVYGLAVYVGESLWQISGSLALATYARLGALSRAEAAALTTRVMRHLLLLLTLVCVGLFLTADIIEMVLFPKYDGMATALRWLLPGVLLYGLAQSLAAFYVYQRGLPWVSAIIAGAGLVLNISFGFLLIPVMGVPGAALASSLAYGISILSALAVFVRQEHLGLSNIFRFGRADLEDYRVLVARLRTLVRPSNSPTPTA